MNKKVKQIVLFSLLIAIIIPGCRKTREGITIQIFPDSVISDVSHHPIGINVDYFMDDDNYLKPARSTVDALKAMGVKYLRYPGGNKSDLYLFSVPPYDKAKPTLARTGEGAVGYDRVIEDNKAYKFDLLNFDEFIAMCREIGAEPVITVAADEYRVDYPEGCTWSTREELIQNAVEWVKYSNIKKGYDVRYWMIGNECWHRNNENSSAEIYARDVVAFSKAMKTVDPSIYIIPNGNSVEFCDTVLDIAGEYIDMFCISSYPVWQYWAGYVSYRDTIQNLMHPVDRALTSINKYATPKGGRKFDLIVCEYGPYDWASTVDAGQDKTKAWPMINDMGHAMCNFEMTGKMLETPEILFSHYWNTRWILNDSLEHSVYDALDKDGNFSATGYSLMIWGNYLGDQMVKTSSTLHLRTFASYTPDRERLYVYLMNMVETPLTVDLDLTGHDIKYVVEAWEYVGEGPGDLDPVWKGFEGLIRNTELILEGTSITVIEYELEKIGE